MGRIDPKLGVKNAQLKLRLRKNVICSGASGGVGNHVGAEHSAHPKDNFLLPFLTQGLIVPKASLPFLNGC